MLETILIKNCKAGDGESFRKLLNIYRTKLYGYLWRFACDQDSAEEMFQETLIKAWKGIKKYNDQNKFSSWLFTIAHNVAMDNLRYQKHNNVVVNIEEAMNQPMTNGPEEEIISKEMIDKINKSIDKLSEKQKTVFLLRQQGELSFKEIAKVTNEPINTVLSHMRYAVKKIRIRVEENNESRKTKVI
jgi:RNA polymerase sigma-70 factor (ECF subfamily)